MKIQYVGINNFSSVGVVFNTPGQLEEVSDKDGRYLLKTFPKLFNEIEPSKVAKPAATKKPKTANKDK